MSATVQIAERPAGEQSPPCAAPEEQGVRAGGGEEEEVLGVGRGARRCSPGDPEAEEESGASPRRPEGRRAVQRGARGPAGPQQ